MEKDEFFLVYQPQVDLESGEVFGVEALLRWRHNAEVIPPFRFIHILEKNREIVPVSKWIIREACRQLAAWNSEGYDIEISINVSAVQFAETGFYDSIAEPIREFGIDPTKLDFEITEGLLIEDIKSTAFKLKQLKMLALQDTKVTDAGLKELEDLKQLATLALQGTKVTDAGVAELQKALPACKITR